jgi:hypothetical protein
MKVAADRFAQLGFTTEEAQARLSQLNDEQLHRIALKVDQLKVGGNALGFAIVALVVVIVAILLLRLLRWTV